MELGTSESMMCLNRVCNYGRITTILIWLPVPVDSEGQMPQEESLPESWIGPWLEEFLLLRVHLSWRDSWGRCDSLGVLAAASLILDAFRHGRMPGKAVRYFFSQWSYRCHLSPPLRKLPRKEAGDALQAVRGRASSWDKVRTLICLMSFLHGCVAQI